MLNRPLSPHSVEHPGSFKSSLSPGHNGIMLDKDGGKSGVLRGPKSDVQSPPFDSPSHSSNSKTAEDGQRVMRCPPAMSDVLWQRVFWSGTHFLFLMLTLVFIE